MFRLPSPRLLACLTGATLSLTLLMPSLALADHHKGSKHEQKSEMTKKKAKHKAGAKSTVVELAAGDERFSTLVAAIQAAQLQETLSGEGPFTVFAPTNEAFDALPSGTLDTLLLPENRQMLTDILTLHVAPTKAKAAQVVKLEEVDTVNGAPVGVMVEGETVTLDSGATTATVIETDLMGSNGVIHVIDAVLLPADD